VRICGMWVWLGGVDLAGVPGSSGAATFAFGVPGADTAVHGAGRVASGFCSASPADRGAPVASGVMYETDGCIMAYT
jgi:hypothetical protein